MKIKVFESDEEKVLVAAHACYYPPKNRGQVAMTFVIEKLVLPEEVDHYTEEDIAKYIEQALNDREGLDK
jgi:hypothetical protein